MGKRKYSVFLGNAGSCSDRYCPAYGRPFSITELFDRVKSVELIEAVDLVLTRDVLTNLNEVRDSIARTGLKVAAVMCDAFNDPAFQQGTLSNPDPKVRERSLRELTFAMDFAAEVGAPIATTWPGQDGYDYLFQADYERDRRWFTEGIAAACKHRPDITVTLECKVKEPRTHCYVGAIGATMLMINEIGAKNLGIAYDYGHSFLAYENPAESVAIMKMYGDRMKHVHINDNFGYWDDDMIVGSVHTLYYLEFFYWCRRSGYNGYYTIDQFPYREDGRDAIEESAKWMDALEGAVEAFGMDEIGKAVGRKDAVLASKMMRKMLFNK